MDDGRLHCYLCPRHCHIGEGQHGFCFIRKNESGRLVQLGYGRPAAVAIDPIEKKPLNHFFPGTTILSMGTAGCNMGCFFCQNWDISKAKSDQVRSADLSPTGCSRTRARASVAAHRLHLQRADDLGRVRHRHRARSARGGHQHGDGFQRLHHPRSVLRHLPLHRRRQHRPESLHRKVLFQGHADASATGARHAALAASRDRRVVRDHEPDHPDAERR